MSADTKEMQLALLADLKASAQFTEVQTFELYSGQLRDDEEIFESALNTPAILSLWAEDVYNSVIENNAKYYAATTIDLLICTHNAASKNDSAIDAIDIKDKLVKFFAGQNLEYTSGSENKVFKIRIARATLVIKTPAKSVVNLQISLEGLR